MKMKPHNKDIYVEIIETPYGIGVAIDDIMIAGSCGGGIMHVKKRLKLNETHFETLIERLVKNAN